MWAQHIALTEFMGVVLTYCVGTVSEMHARQSFVRTHRLEHLDWQPGVLPRLMMQTLEHLRIAKSYLLGVLSIQGKQQETDAVKQSSPSKGSADWEVKQLPGAVSADRQDSCGVVSAMHCTRPNSTSAARVPCSGLQFRSAESTHPSTACCPGPARRCQAVKEQPLQAAEAQHKEATACCPAAVEAGMAGAYRDVSLAVGYQGTMCESPDSLSSKASSSSDSGSDTDVSEAQKVCCGVQGVQALACQKLLNKGKALDSKCRQLACRYASHNSPCCSHTEMLLNWPPCLIAMTPVADCACGEQKINIGLHPAWSYLGWIFAR